MTDGPVLETQDGGLVTLVLNRPERRNALDQEMIDALHETLTRLWTREDVGVVILTGADDRSFVAGADIQQLRDRRLREALLSINSSLFQRFEEAPFPTIAAIRGYALGGGCELAMACDMRIAGESSKFGQPEVGLGIVPGAGATYRLPRLVGPGKAKELIFSGRLISAAEAERIGLINQCVPDAEVLPAAETLAKDILKQDRLAVQLAKALMRIDGGFRPGSGQIAEAVAQGILFESEEKNRRMTAFLDRRRKS
jgi:enoyl-CoA hydratase